MAKNISLEITTSNLGPHESLKTKLQSGSIEMGIYANNGSGKTFLSRAFRLSINNSLEPNDSNKLLTLGKSEGNFKLKILDSRKPGVNKTLEFQIKKDTTPIVKNDTGYLFRVFNEDYIKENLEGLKYRPNSEIEGYIVGKEKIDLSKEKGQLEKFKKNQIDLNNKLKNQLAASIEELDNLSIRKNTFEYQEINLENLINSRFSVKETDSFQELLTKHNQLKAIPDNIMDLKNVAVIRNTNTLFNLENFLTDSFSKSRIAEEFKLKVKLKQSFVETGVEFVNKDNTKCPFCEQKLEDSALNLIDKYVEYLKESEALQIKKADDLFSQLISDRKEYRHNYKETLKLNVAYSQYLGYIPSIEKNQLNHFKDIKELDLDYKILKDALEEKKQDISKSLNSDEIIKAIQNIKNWKINTNNSIELNDVLIAIFNSKKNNINKERLGLNRRLCNAKFNEIRGKEKPQILNISELEVVISKLTTEITQKEQSEKISKKQKVVNTFKSLLTIFFGSKYSFDDETFCIKFRNQLLKSNAGDVLSTGEKSVIAFCFYIAESHTVVENEIDYEKLFFVIDDPISSQDFHFVYATSQIIRTLNKIFSTKYTRFIILTHNLEFMSIIIRNKIIKQKYFLSEGEIKKLGNELIMPYEEHLRDIYKVAKGKSNPTHTTPNSLRHILETINRFTSPNLDLIQFCEGINGYSENEFLFSLMHDGSHGGIRLQKAYTDIMIKSACEVVSNYIETNFGGQIKILMS
jgi:hypothetical protein